MNHDQGSDGQAVQHFGQTGSDFASADILGSDMENISVSTLFTGLQVSTGIRFAVLFAAFIGWLYVVYWIRHHEPFVNQAIGISAPHSPTAAADRSLIARIGKVFPFQTPTMGDGLYAPTPGVAVPSPQPNSNFGLGIYNKSFGEANRENAHTINYAAPGQAVSSPLIGPSEQEFDPRFGRPAHP